MRYLVAMVACAGLFILFVAISVTLFGPGHYGGVVGALNVVILVTAMGVTWRAITKQEKPPALLSGTDLHTTAEAHRAEKSGGVLDAAQEKRLQTLERELRAVKRRNGWVLFVLSVALVGAYASDYWPLRRVIRAEEFRVTDAEGKTRASLRTYGEFSTLALSDKTGSNRVELMAFDMGSMLGMYHQSSFHARMSLQAFAGGPTLMFLGTNRPPEQQVVVSGNDFGRPSLSLYDQNGEYVWGSH